MAGGLEMLSFLKSLFTLKEILIRLVIIIPTSMCGVFLLSSFIVDSNSLSKLFIFFAAIQLIFIYLVYKLISLYLVEN